MWKKIPFFTLAFSDWKPFKLLIFRIFDFDFWRNFARKRKQRFKRQASRQARRGRRFDSHQVGFGPP